HKLRREEVPGRRKTASVRDCSELCSGRESTFDSFEQNRCRPEFRYHASISSESYEKSKVITRSRSLFLASGHESNGRSLPPSFASIVKCSYPQLSHLARIPTLVL